MPPRQSVSRSRRRGSRPPARQNLQQPVTRREQGAGAEQTGDQPDRLPERVASQRALAAARAREMAKQDVRYLRHDLRNVLAIAVVMLAIIIALSFVLH